MLGQPGEHSTAIDPDGTVILHYDVDQPVDAAALPGVLTRPRCGHELDITLVESGPVIPELLASTSDNWRQNLPVGLYQLQVLTLAVRPRAATIRSRSIVDG